MKLAVLSQTTQSENLFNKIASLMKENFLETTILNTICNSTSSRQDEVESMCKTCDTILVIGGFDSANTKRLVEISKKSAQNTIWIENSGTIDSHTFSDTKTSSDVFFC